VGDHVRTLLVLLALAARGKPRHPHGDDADAAETAWKIHATIVDWTGKVDQKASFALAVESAVVLGVIALSDTGKPLSALSGFWQLWLYRVGIGLLVFAVVLVMAAVIPRLRRDKMDDEWRENLIFFGHLKRWQRDELSKALRQRDMLPVLSAQLINMSQIAWRKHRDLQFSLWLAGFGTFFVWLAFMLHNLR
jgi:hypothetical protein